MDKSYFKAYYKLEREHWWFTARSNILKSIINNALLTPRTLKILNVGVATGATSEMLLEFGTVTSIEYDEDCCNFINKHSNLNVQNGSITGLNFETNSFDLVCAFDVIEHVENDILAASELLRVCKTDGIVFVTTPAYNFLWSEHDEVNHHFRRYTLTRFKRLFLLPSKNFIKQTYFNIFLFPPIALVRILLWPFQKRNQKNNQNAETDATRFNLGFLNKVLYQIFVFEKRLLKFLSFPFGVSIALVIKK